MEHTDVAVAIGANDVVNPDAEENTKDSPLYGMPISKVHHSRGRAGTETGRRGNLPARFASGRGAAHL